MYIKLVYGMLQGFFLEKKALEKELRPAKLLCMYIKFVYAMLQVFFKL